jgi:hypothetical protein
MKADFAGPSRTDLFSPLSVVRLHSRFATPVMRPAGSGPTGSVNLFLDQWAAVLRYATTQSDRGRHDMLQNWEALSEFMA